MISPSCVFFGFPPELNDAFLREYGRRSVRIVRFAACLALATCLTFAFWPTTVAKANPYGSRIYLGFMAPGFVLWIAFTFWRRAARYLHWASAIFGSFVMGLGSVLFLYWVPERAYLHYPAGEMLISMLLYAGLRLPFMWATVVGCLYTAAFLACATQINTFQPTSLSLAVLYALSTDVLGMMIAFSMERSLRSEFLDRREIAAERSRSDRLLLNILPGPIAERLKAGEKVIADEFKDVTILFADIVGYTGLAGRLSPAELVELLNEVFSRFDRLAQSRGAEKIKTIGDAYMAVGGLPKPLSGHADAMAGLGLEMLAEVQRINQARGRDLSLRIGLHSGPVVAGVIGDNKFSYDLWGDAVNVASRMESHGVVGCVHLSETVASRLSSKFRPEKRGVVEIKGKGPMTTFLLRPEPAG